MRTTLSLDDDVAAQLDELPVGLVLRVVVDVIRDGPIGGHLKRARALRVGAGVGIGFGWGGVLGLAAAGGERARRGDGEAGTRGEKTGVPSFVSFREEVRHARLDSPNQVHRHVDLADAHGVNPNGVPIGQDGFKASREPAKALLKELGPSRKQIYLNELVYLKE